MKKTETILPEPSPKQKTSKLTPTKPTPKSAAESKTASTIKTLGLGAPTWANNAELKNLMKFERRSAAYINKALGRSNIKSDGIELPYYGIDGDPTGYSRYRLDVPVPKGPKGKGFKYLQKANSGNPPYFSPGVKWWEHLADKTKWTVITEGEVKAACSTLFGQPAIAIGGVWNWSGKAQGLKLHPDLAKVLSKGSKVAIVFDSDASDKPHVAQAEARLAGALVDLGCIVKVVRLGGAL